MKFHRQIESGDSRFLRGVWILYYIRNNICGHDINWFLVLMEVAGRIARDGWLASF